MGWPDSYEEQATHHTKPPPFPFPYRNHPETEIFSKKFPKPPTAKGKKDRGPLWARIPTPSRVTF